MKYKSAIEKFNTLLESDVLVESSANHYNVSIEQIIKALQCRIHTKSNQSGNVVKVWLDFLDTNTMTKFNHTITF